MAKDGDPRMVLITTTIYVPKVLELYRALDPDVTILVVGDKKTPHEETRRFVEGLGNSRYYSDRDQEGLGYECSEVIGWNKIMRRNVALLEAIKSGPDIIVSIDDDNIPLAPDYFDEFRRVLGAPFKGALASSERNWFNVGQFLVPPIYPRGFPHDFRGVDLGVRMQPATNLRIGVAAGLWLGDPDIDAVDRIATAPTVYAVSDLIHAGIAVGRGCFAPFNSQNTAYLAELAPVMMVLVGVGRYDDIWGSYIAQRLMMETEYHLHFGRPLVWQERNAQSQWTNLQDEGLGMQWSSRLCGDLRHIALAEGDLVTKLRQVFEELQRFDYIPPIVFEFGKAWCADLERVLER